MVMQDLNLMAALLQKMDWTENRQKLLAANIANADTAGYKAQDLEPLDFKDLLGSSTSKLSLAAASSAGSAHVAPSALETTDPKHISVNTGSVSVGGDGTRQKRTYETSPDGNSVILEEQLVKMNSNFADHSLATNLYLRNMAMLKTSLKSS